MNFSSNHTSSLYTIFTSPSVPVQFDSLGRQRSISVYIDITQFKSQRNWRTRVASLTASGGKSEFLYSPVGHSGRDCGLDSWDTYSGATENRDETVFTDSWTHHMSIDSGTHYSETDIISPSSTVSSTSKDIPVYRHRHERTVRQLVFEITFNVQC